MFIMLVNNARVGRLQISISGVGFTCFLDGIYCSGENDVPRIQSRINIVVLQPSTSVNFA